MFEAFLRALGRGIMAVIAGLWNAIVMPILHGIGHGIGGVVQRVAPWVVAATGLWLLVVFKPEAANAVL